MEGLSAEHVPERGGGQEPCGLIGVLHFNHTGHMIVNLEEDHSVHSDSDTVFGQDLLGRDIEGDCPQVHSDDVINAGEDGEQPGAHSAALLDPPEPEDHSSLVFLEIQIQTLLLKFDFLNTHLNLLEDDKEREWESDAAKEHRKGPEESPN